MPRLNAYQKGTVELDLAQGIGQLGGPCIDSVVVELPTELQIDRFELRAKVGNGAQRVAMKLAAIVLVQLDQVG